MTCSLLVVTGYPVQAEISHPDSGEELSGGGTTVFEDSGNAFTLSARNLLAGHRTAFFLGHSFFNENWVAASASISARDGLGPLFVGRSCSACHIKDGRSAPGDPGSTLETIVVRISIPGFDEHGGPKADPIYGLQLQTQALPGAKPEATVKVDYEVIEGIYADGERFTLRRPKYTLTNPAYGRPATNLIVSALVAPGVIGLGLLEAVPEQTLLQLADSGDAIKDGISGRRNLVWDAAARRRVTGRFGWKAEQPTVFQQCAAAFNGDMGLTTSIFPKENYTAAESDCARLPSGGNPEVSDDILDAVVTYCRTLAVPARRDCTNVVVRQGEELFGRLACAACHIARLTTGDMAGFPELSRQVIHPYTDLLLHDMGEGLADGRQVFEASGRHWRTPPLWGIGLVEKVNGHMYFMHDGRARNFAEAVLWHGGEARRAKEQFRQLAKPDRDALVRFLESL